MTWLSCLFLLSASNFLQFMDHASCTLTLLCSHIPHVVTVHTSVLVYATFECMLAESRLDCSDVCLLILAVASERSWVRQHCVSVGEKGNRVCCMYCFSLMRSTDTKCEIESRIEMKSNKGKIGSCKFSGPTVPVGTNVMLMNGLPVDVTSLELYELMDRISAEVTSVHQCLLL